MKVTSLLLALSLAIACGGDDETDAPSPDYRGINLLVAVNLTDQDQVVTLTTSVTDATLVFGTGEVAGTSLKLPGAASAVFSLE